MPKRFPTKSLVLINIILLIFCPMVLAFTWGLPGLEIPEASILYDINGRPIQGLSDQNRISVSIDEISPAFIQAIIAVEDKNFYQHHGVDIGGILRAAWKNLKAGSVVEGGSTITQQTAKKLFLSDERTVLRKIKELYYSLLLEREYSKDEILALYCNTIYFGHGAYGVEVAARTFFAKNAGDLNQAEAALLAGLPRWPSHYDPYQNPEAAKERQQVVLTRMLDEGMITPEEKQKTAGQKLNYHESSYISGDAPYFVAQVQEYLSDKYGEHMVYQGGLKVYTTLDLDMQRAASKAYNEGMKGKDSEMQAALVALDVKTGQIRAMIGGRDFNRSNYNRIYAQRQPGSTFKPFMYSLALDSGYTAATMSMCEPITYKIAGSPDYTPADYGSEPYHNRLLTIKEAVSVSDNVIAVQVNKQLGPSNVAARAEAFGFKKVEPVLSLPLGSTEVSPLEISAAYAVFANRGVYNEPYALIKVVDKNGRVLESHSSLPKRVVDEENAYLVTHLLQGVLEPGGTGAALKVPGLAAAAKTGTTDERKDAWFVGYTPNTCCAVWVGYDKDRNVNLTGSTAGGPIWKSFMQGSIAKVGGGDFQRPDGVVIVNIDLDTGLVASEACTRTAAMAFRSGTEPKEICYVHSPWAGFWSGWW